MTNPRFRLVARDDQRAFLELPWQLPLKEWPAELLVDVKRGIGRHVVRFVDLDGAFYALKELPQRFAEREYRLLGEEPVQRTGKVAGGELEGTTLQGDLQKVRTDAKSDKEAVLAELDKAKALNKKLMDLIDEQAFLFPIEG